jgi:beta-lactamase regulating signal transducer with metallopeptidase domain
VNSSVLIALLNHLWQSTLFILAVGCLTRLLRKNSARVRYCLWLTASAKFLIPFALLIAIGVQIPWPRDPVQGTEPSFSSSVGQAAAPVMQFDESGFNALPPAPHASSYSYSVLVALGGLWALGTFVVAARWFIRWLLVRRALGASTDTNLEFLIPAKLSSSQLEPAVVGILRPVLLLPKGLEQRLTPEEMRSVLAHERCHVLWRDNLAAAVHMLVEALFWFHPLIWWLGTRLVAERERACDEHVLAAGHSRTTYAEGILKVCEHYLTSRLACVAGMSGSNLKDRIAAITNNSQIERLSAVRKLLITAAACTTIAAPIAVGIFTSTQAHAQAQAPAPGEVYPAAGRDHSWGVRGGSGGMWFGPKVKMNKWSADRLSTAMNGTWILEGNVHIEATFETVRQIRSPSRYIVTTDVTIDADRVVITPKREGGSAVEFEKGHVDYVVRTGAE